MATESERENAFGLLLGAAVFSALSASAVVQRPDYLLHSPGRMLLSLGISWSIGAILGCSGWRRLRELKKERPDASWLVFLRRELILTAVVVTLLAVVVAMPEEWLKAVWDFLHETEMMRFVARGGHP